MEDLSKPLDFENNIVRILYTDGAKKAYRVNNLNEKSVQEVVKEILKYPNCPLCGQSDVYLWENIEEGIFGSTSCNQLEGTLLMTFLSEKWTKEKKKVNLLMKKQNEPTSARNTAARTTSLIDLPIRKVSSTITSASKKNRKATLTKIAIQNVGEFVDENHSRYALTSPTAKQKEPDATARPLSQFLTAESWKEGFDIDSPEISKIRQHQTVLVAWVNMYLSERKMHISDLHKDIKDGVALINLLEIISGKNVREYHKKPATVQEKLQNCDLVIKFFGKLGIEIEAGPKDIYMGKMSVLFGALYSLIRSVKEKKYQKPKKGRRDIVSIQLTKEEIDIVDTDLPSPIKSPRPTNLPTLSQLPVAQEPTVSPRLTPKPLPQVPKQKAMKTNSIIRGSVKAGTFTGQDIQKQLVNEAKKFDDELEELISGPSPRTISTQQQMSQQEQDQIVGDILESAKRLKDIKISKPTVPVHQSNIPNLAELTDEQLEALLNDDRYDIGNIGELDFEFNEDPSVVSKKNSYGTIVSPRTPSVTVNNSKQTPTSSYKPSDLFVIKEAPTSSLNDSPLYNMSNTESFQLPHFELPHFELPQQTPPKAKNRISVSLNAPVSSFEDDLESLKLDLGEFTSETTAGIDIDWDF